MEALKIKLEGLDNVTLSYKAHIENIGDKTFDSDAEIIGTEGQALRLEAITVNADGIEDTDYSLQYRVHIENEGTTTVIGKYLDATKAAIDDVKVTDTNAVATIKATYRNRKHVDNNTLIESNMNNVRSAVTNAQAKNIADIITAAESEMKKEKDKNDLDTIADKYIAQIVPAEKAYYTELLKKYGTTYVDENDDTFTYDRTKKAALEAEIKNSEATVATLKTAYDALVATHTEYTA